MVKCNFSIGILLILPLFWSCVNKEVEPEYANTCTLFVGDEKFSSTEGYMPNYNVSVQDYANSLAVRMEYYKPGGADPITMQFFLTKTGALRTVEIWDWREDNIPYRAPQFHPRALFSITDFNYNPINKHLYFKFDGDLIKECNNRERDIVKPRKHFSGEFSAKNLTLRDITSIESTIDFKTANIEFLTSDIDFSFNSERLDNPMHYTFFSENGNRILFKCVDDLWLLDKGTYTFAETTITNRIDLYDYIGMLRGFQGLAIRDSEWKQYQSTGSFTIIAHRTIGNVNETVGSFNLNVFDNGVLKYAIQDAPFSVESILY